MVNNNERNVKMLPSPYKKDINLMRHILYLATLMYMSDMYYNWENYLSVTGGYQHALYAAPYRDQFNSSTQF